MSGNQESNPPRGYQRTYEERTASVQQHIRHLLDELRRLATIVRESRPSAQDDVTRLVQRHAAIRPTTQLIRNYIVEYLRADAEWDRTILEFRLYEDRSEWAQTMLHQRNLFYHGLSLASAPLDFLYAQLLEDVQRTLQDIETFIHAAPIRDVQPRQSATAPQDPQIGTGPTHPVGSDATHSAAETRSVPPYPGERNSSLAAATTRTTSTTRQPPADQHHRHDEPHRGTNVRTFVNTSYRRSGTTGIMRVTDGNVADAIPLAWTATRDRELRPGTTQALYSVAPPPVNAGSPTHPVGNLAAEPERPSEQPHPPRTIDPEHKRRLQRVLVNTVSGGRGPSNVTSSVPLRVGADGRPFDSSATSAAQASTDFTADFGEDFARENSSSFYRNAKFTRRPIQATTTLPPFLLKELPLTPFDGDIRSYQDFRDGFLEMVEARRNLEPSHKLVVLRQHLRGTPLDLTEGFPISDESYLEVIDLLEQTYGDKDVLANLLTQDIINLPSPKMKREELQLFLDKARPAICRLRYLGPGYGSDKLLVQILLGKLPDSMKMKLLENHDSATLDANAILKGVREVVSIQDRAHSAGLTFHQGPQRMPTTPWSNPPGSFQQNQHQPQGRPNHKPASDHHQFHVAEFVTSNVTERIHKAKKKNKRLPSLGGDHSRLSCPSANGPKPQANRRLREPKDHSPVADLLLSGRSGHGFVRSDNTLKPGVLDVTSPPIEDVPTPKPVPEPPTASRVRSTNDEARSFVRGSGNSDIRKTASTKRTASRRGGTPRQTTSSGGSSNPQGATACSYDGSLLGQRKTLSADKGSTRTRTTQDASDQAVCLERPNPRTGPFSASGRTLLGSRDLRSNEEVLIQKPRKPRRRRSVVSKQPVATSKRFTEVGPTAQPTTDPSTAVLLECVKVRASAPVKASDQRLMRTMRTNGQQTFNGSLRPFKDVIVFFDSGCSRSCVSRQFLGLLQLPQRQKHTHHVNIFGTRPPIAVEGTDTTITLWTTDYRPITFDAIAFNTIITSVTTALVEKTDLPLLRSGRKALRPTRLTPDVLIGQDLVHLFDRQLLPRLPHGFQVVSTHLGLMIGGAGQLAIAPASDAARPSTSSLNTENHLPTRSPTHPVGNRPDLPQSRPLHPSGTVPAGPYKKTERDRLCPCEWRHASFECEIYTTLVEQLLRGTHVCESWNQENTVNKTVTALQTTEASGEHPSRRSPGSATLSVAPPTPPATGSSNPLDTTEPLLSATTTAIEASTANSATTAEEIPRPGHQKIAQRLRDFASFVLRTLNSRKTRLRRSSDRSEEELGNHH